MRLQDIERITVTYEALVACRGKTVAYWVEHGAPPLTDELLICLLRQSGSR